jgi:hypothetical protein
VSTKFLGTMDEWMRDQEKRMTSVERRRRGLGGSAGSGGASGFDAVGAQSADRAVQFIKSMMLPSTPLVSDAKIRPDVIYPADYIGPVSGTYDIPMASEPTYNPTPLVVSTPVGVIGDAYRGMVFGSINVTAATGMTIKTYKRSDTDYEMPTVGTVDPSSGNWNLDLSSTPDWQAGTWVFALLQNGTQVGEKWPWSTSYLNIKVENRVITDTSYPVGTPNTQPARVEGRFRFNYSLQGRKQLRLLRPVLQGGQR